MVQKGQDKQMAIKKDLKIKERTKMCKETKEELKKGEKLAKGLLEHLKNMGAAQCKIPLTDTDGIKYWVKVEQTDNFNEDIE